MQLMKNTLVLVGVALLFGVATLVLIPEDTVAKDPDKPTPVTIVDPAVPISGDINVANQPLVTAVQQAVWGVDLPNNSQLRPLWVREIPFMAWRTGSAGTFATPVETAEVVDNHTDDLFLVEWARLEVRLPAGDKLLLAELGHLNETGLFSRYPLDVEFRGTDQYGKDLYVGGPRLPEPIRLSPQGEVAHRLGVILERWPNTGVASFMINVSLSRYPAP